MVTMIFPMAAYASWCICLCINKKREQKMIHHSVLTYRLCWFIRDCERLLPWQSSTFHLVTPQQAVHAHDFASWKAVNHSKWGLRYMAAAKLRCQHWNTCPWLHGNISSLTAITKSQMDQSSKISNLGLRALNIFHCPLKLLLPFSNFRS